MQGLKRLFGWALKYGAVAWIAVLAVWYLVISTLRNGISCDEGYYLLGFLRNQDVEWLGTDFHAIVRAMTRAFVDDDIMVYRYLRLILHCVSIVLFAVSSYEWLSRKKGLQVRRWAYYPTILLSGVMAYTFATPTISYDSLELIIVLAAASLFFVLLCSGKKLIRFCCVFGIGFLLWFACSNYPPAGVCLVALFTIAYLLEIKERRWGHLLVGGLGMLAAIVVSHFFIHDMMVWFSEMSKVFISTFTEESQSNHDAGSLVSVMLITVAKALLILIPAVVLFTWMYRKIRVSDKVQWLVVLAVCAVLLVVKQIYELHSVLYLFPVALLVAKILAQPGTSLKGVLLSKDAFLVLILIAIPFAGVFGTNQPILNKAIVFVSFWVLAFFYLSTLMKAGANNRLALLFITILLAGYVWQGNFQRYHYYYTPRSAKYEMVGASRPQKVLISKYQQEYYRDLIDSLNVAGCKPGDLYMAFGENQMAVYLAGGYVSGRLPYHWWQYKSFDSDAPKAFIFFKNEESGVISHFQDAGWGFPDQYKRMELRQMSQNMGEDYRTVIYAKSDH